MSLQKQSNKIKIEKECTTYSEWLGLESNGCLGNFVERLDWLTHFSKLQGQPITSTAEQGLCKGWKGQEERELQSKSKGCDSVIY